MADVIVVGGGIAGCTTALYLAADGVDVLLLEQGDLNTGASGTNAGSLHAQIQHEPFLELGDAWARRFAPAVPFFLESIALWQQAQRLVDTDLEVSLDGGLLVAADDEQMRQVEAKARIERSCGLSIEILGRAELEARAPYIARRMVGGAFCPSEGKANPLVAAPAFARAAERLGARILRNQRVASIRRVGAEYEVATAQARFRAPRVVDAAGMEAGRIAALVGAALPIQAFPIQLTVTEPVVPLVLHLVYSARERLTLKQTRQGTILIGGGWPSLVDEQGRAQVSAQSLSRNLAVALDTVPALANVNVMRTWAAIVNGTADWLPLLGEVPGVPGFYLNYVPWMGFTGGPAGGRIVASLVQGKAPPVAFDCSPFQP